MRQKRKEIALSDSTFESVIKTKTKNLSCPKVEL